MPFLHHHRTALWSASDADESSASTVSRTEVPQAPAPVLNGKRVIPYRVMAAGLKGQKVAAVYAILNSTYNRGQEGWDAAVHVGVSQDLDTTLQSLVDEHGGKSVAHVRALSFSFPQPGAMQEIASQWKELALDAGANIDPKFDGVDDALNYLYDDDDDDDDDEFEDIAQIAGDAVVSPFDANKENEVAIPERTTDVPLVFNAENVDKVLDEVRPYLISDGGNVAVDRVDEEAKNVYLKLEGACGSCASSTVTMQMGIERTLRENFEDLNEVLQVDSDTEPAVTELTREAVEDEVNRLGSAISAMGGVVRLLAVDSATGVVKLMYRGPNKVQQGLEMAVRDLPFVNSVEFTMGDD